MQASPTLAPDDALCQLVLDREVAPDLDLQFGVSLFTGPVRAMTTDQGEPPQAGVPGVPARSVFVLLVGGDPPRISHDQCCRMSNLHVWVRSAMHEFAPGQYLARAVWNQIFHNLIDNYVEVECLQSEPQYMGADDTHHHRWMIAVRMQYWIS